MLACKTRQLSLLWIILLIAVSQLAICEESEISFEREVQPILTRHCIDCHGENSRKAELDLSSASGLLLGGESGSVLQAEPPDQGLLYAMIHDRLMPPEDRPALKAAEIEILKNWIIQGASFGSGDSASNDSVVTEHDVTPIFFRRCTVCHGAQFVEGGLDLRTLEGIFRGGDSGPALKKMSPPESAIVQRVRERLCPPREALGEAGIEPMNGDELEVVEKWIAAGAPVSPQENDSELALNNDPLVDPRAAKFWSFESPLKSAVPEVIDSELVRNPIDNFLLQRLEQHGLTYSAESDKLTLLRRATFDLTGLPPTPEEMGNFLRDQDPEAYERVIERLLDSPGYGERWGRVWLDLAGYADSEGKRQADTVRPWAWRYRDYVISAFNEDKPYDQFLLEQIAGDELVDYANPQAVNEETIEKLIATGFLRMAPDGTSADPVNRITDRIEVIADEVDVLGRGVMGLTFNCARCHSHKYDPLPQRDYYRMVALFKGAYDEYDWFVPQPFNNQWNKATSRYLTVNTPAERDSVEEHNRPLQEQIRQLEQEWQQRAEDKEQIQRIESEIKDLKSKLRELPKIRALWDRGQPSPTYVYRRGDDMQPSRLVDAGVPVVLTAAVPAVHIEPLDHSTPKTGRRLALARWLTQPQHPLTARVLVNRIWQQHFGTGIVKSLDNFGALGTPPSHPQLLDWLSVEFVENGWSIKHLHRLIMTSTAYRQRSEWSETHQELDPENRLISRMPMRRLNAEEVRDSILFLAKKLDLTPFGEPDPVEVRGDGLVTSKPMNGMWRRSVYVRQRRKEMPTILETFDLPQMNPNCILRTDSTVVSQPLHLMNNQMIYELASDLAKRIEAEAGSHPSEQVRRAWMVVCNQPPLEQDMQISLQAIAELQHQWSVELNETQVTQAVRERALGDFCHALINSASFLYID